MNITVHEILSTCWFGSIWSMKKTAPCR